MTVYRVPLKFREQADQVAMPVARLQDLMRGGDRERLWTEFVPFLERKPSIHDKFWLEMILDWVPGSKAPNGQFVPDGLPLTEQAKWIDLARRIRRVQEEDGAVLRLYGWEAEMIWKRVTDGRFLMQRFSLPLLEFLLELGHITGNVFPGALADPPLLNEEEIEDDKSIAQLNCPPSAD